MEGGLHVFDFAFGDQPVFNQTISIKRQRCFLLFDLLVHNRVGEHRFITFVMAKTTIANKIQHDVFVELLTILSGDAGGMHHGLGVVTVDVENRGLDHQRIISGVGAGTAEVRRGGKADLVVHHDMHGSAGAMPAQPRKRKTLCHDALTGKCRIAMQQDRQNGNALLVVQLVLFGANLAQNDRVNCFEV